MPPTQANPHKHTDSVKNTSQKCYLWEIITLHAKMKFRLTLACTLAALTLISCAKDSASATDPLPLPADLETSKDLSVKPGDSFYDYCNGTWLKNTPIPATGATGGMYDQDAAMKQYSNDRLASFPKKDEHSHARLRVNGVVMNTDLWYELYNVDRNNVLYLPPERRTHI